MLRRLLFVFVVLIAAVGGYALRGAVERQQTAGAQGPPGFVPPEDRKRDRDPNLPIPVVAGPVQQKDVPILLSGIGTVTAYNTVQVRARLDGQLVQVAFKEGQDVKAGDLLAVIDQRPYQAALKQAQANLAKDKAQLANARLDLDRDVNLREYASRQKVDTDRASVAQLEAQVAADQAQIDSAATNLDYTSIRSPISGRTGIRGVDVGNIVHAADSTQIVTVTQIQPISVVFTLPAENLPAINRAAPAGPLKVYAYSKDNQAALAEGQLELVDNQIDATTGTVKLKATFANQDRSLWPGQFVNARLLVDTQRDGLVVPATVVQRGPNGTFAWVVGAGSTVAMRPITVQQTQDGQALIAQGLKSGEQVVIDGQYKLQTGTKVEIVAPTPGAGGPGPA